MSTPLQDAIIAQMRQGPVCVYEIAKRVTSTEKNVRRAVMLLQDRGIVRPKGWEASGKRKRMMFELVPFRQAQRSKP